MKKVFISLLLVLFLTGCQGVSTNIPTETNEPTETLEPTTEEPILTPEVPNDLPKLVAAEDCTVPTLDGGWVCIWADEFDSDFIDTSKWTIRLDGSGGGNQELQYYRPDNAEIVDGKLVITAKKETYLNKNYTSARLDTMFTGRFEYVRVVVRAKMPAGRGTWPAIWMMPVSTTYGVWPRSGEIDIMEYVGYDKNRIHSTIHTQKYNGQIGTQLGFSRLYPNVETEFYDYEMIWKPGIIQTFVNGDRLGNFGYTPAFNQDVPYNQAFPFDHPFYLIINLAIGGNWGGVQGVDDDIFPTSLEVEHVRVYKQDYRMLDEFEPSKPLNLSLAQLKNSLYWNPSVDDYGVEKYAIYLNGVFYKYTNLNQHSFTNLVSNESYMVQVQAIDFVGRVSELSDSFSFTFLP
jgi:beta-glucanase (GH16 family)